jgi:hypothetical protein
VEPVEYKNKFRKILLTYNDIEIITEKCSELTERLIKERSMHFAEWLKYNDEIFEKYATNKIPMNSLYNIFIDNTKP